MTSGVGVLGTYAYDQLGRRNAVTLGNGTIGGYSYDPVSRLSQLVENLSGTSHDLTLGFTYNAAGQIAGNTRSNDTYAWTSHYVLNRAYTANGLNRYTAITGSTTPTYDGRGNLTAAGGATYGYNSGNMLTSASGGVTLSYDPMQRLYETVGGGVTTRMGYDGQSLIAEYNASNTLLRRYVHGPGVDEHLVWYEGTGTSDRRWLHADERGSIVAVSNSSGTVTNVNAYDEYGIPRATNVGRFQYTGQQWIAELGMYHYRARIYWPTLGRFLQTDPIGYGGGMNLHAYVGNDPVNSSDPSGLADMSCTGSLICPKRDGGGGGLSGGLSGASSGFSNEAAGAFIGLSSGGSGGFVYVPGVPGPVTGTGGDGPNQTISVTARSPGHFYFAGGFGGSVASSGMFHLASQESQRGDFHFRIRDFALCSADELFAEFREPGNSAPGAPYARSGINPDIILAGGNPITQIVNVGARTITNVTQVGHRYHPGTVEIRVISTWYGSAVSIEGRGTGAHYLENSALGSLLFKGLAARATFSCTVGAD